MWVDAGPLGAASANIEAQTLAGGLGVGRFTRKTGPGGAERVRI